MKISSGIFYCEDRNPCGSSKNNEAFLLNRVRFCDIPVRGAKLRTRPGFGIKAYLYSDIKMNEDLKALSESDKFDTYCSIAEPLY